MRHKCRYSATIGQLYDPGICDQVQSNIEPANLDLTVDGMCAQARIFYDGDQDGVPDEIKPAIDRWYPVLRRASA